MCRRTRGKAVGGPQVSNYREGSTRVSCVVNYREDNMRAPCAVVLEGR